MPLLLWVNSEPKNLSASYLNDAQDDGSEGGEMNSEFAYPGLNAVFTGIDSEGNERFEIAPSGGKPIKERPIIFSAPMVRAILDGKKSQTRRVVKPQPIYGDVDGLFASWKFIRNNRYWLYPNAKDEILASCPHGKPGDRLWVREKWGVVSHAWDNNGDMIDWEPDRPATPVHEMSLGKHYYNGHVIYAADGENEWSGDDDGGGEPRSAWHPSIHMPRRASRILLEITNVRADRLQDISEDDAIAEGITGPCQVGYQAFRIPDDSKPRYSSAVSAFEDLWGSINGPGSWDANPWVWVIEFKVIK